MSGFPLPPALPVQSFLLDDHYLEFEKIMSQGPITFTQTAYHAPVAKAICMQASISNGRVHAEVFGNFSDDLAEHVMLTIPPNLNSGTWPEDSR
ncbi:hypothetical protein PHLCEN_2v2601 [Hermanssonia centrifuga]|uniref:Uncharacterized protein n=1 Tax=Hermanssonia centrifuga TaxID=98765 RepID=A0A2R6RLI0_9APHY|nr:hypothetical protein PHLCEN_2v2601 [Hermanssonia centrifuga]